MKTIVAIDDSPTSEQVVSALIKRVWPARISFKVLTVIEPVCCAPEDLDASGNSEIEANQNKARHQTAEKLCNKVRDEILSHLPGAKVNCEIREGLASFEIVNAATDWSADEILIGGRSRDICPRNLTGSVSRAVVDHAPCTVEIVHY